jgi:hypothetical protein
LDRKEFYDTYVTYQTSCRVDLRVRWWMQQVFSRTFLRAAEILPAAVCATYIIVFLAISFIDIESQRVSNTALCFKTLSTPFVRRRFLESNDKEINFPTLDLVGTIVSPSLDHNKISIKDFNSLFNG